VDSDQKSYYDRQFGVKLPYSSGQQVKRSFMDEVLKCLDERHAPLTFNYEVDKDKLSQKEITQPCDPSYYDQLLGGWMSTPSKKGGKDEESVDSSDKNSYKRRSPFSISAMTAVHPLLASLVNESLMTFDRTTISDDKIVVRDKESKKELTSEEISLFLEKCNHKISKRNLISGKDRSNGFFTVDIAIDLRKLFRIPILMNDPEISIEIINKLKSNGWIAKENKMGMYLELPKEYHQKVAEAVAWSLINWRITSNQSRTFDLMPVLSVAISDNANEISNVIRGELNVDDGKYKAKLVVDNNEYPNTKVYSQRLLGGYVSNVTTSVTAINDAVNHIKNAILNYYNSNIDKTDI
jgi:hypothetical protein